MSTLSNIVDVTITSSGRGISRAGFGTPLVISVFPPSIFAERFKLDALVLAQLNAPNIVRIYDFDPQNAFLVMLVFFL